MRAAQKIAAVNIAVCVLATVLFHVVLLSRYLPAQNNFEKRVQDIMSTSSVDLVGMSELLKNHGVMVTFTGARDAWGKSADNYVAMANEFVGRPHLDLIFQLRAWVTWAGVAFVVLNVVALFCVRGRTNRVSP